MADELKRNTAHKIRIGEISIGKPVINNEKLSFFELGDKKIVRVNVIGNIIDKFSSEGEKNFEFLTIDDGSGQIKIKAFGDDAKKLKPLIQGQTILCIGTLKHFRDE